MLPDAIVRARPGPGAALDVVAARDPTRTASVARMTVMLRSRMAPPPPPPMASDEDGPTVATGHAAHIDGTPQPHAGITLMTAAAVGVRMCRAERSSAAYGEGPILDRPSKLIAPAGWVLTLLVVVATAVLFSLDGIFGGDPVSNAIGLLGIACYAAIGGLIAWRLPGNACGWLLLWIGGGIAMGLFTDALATVAVREGHATL